MNFSKANVCGTTETERIRGVFSLFLMNQACIILYQSPHFCLSETFLSLFAMPCIGSRHLSVVGVLISGQEMRSKMNHCFFLFI